MTYHDRRDVYARNAIDRAEAADRLAKALAAAGRKAVAESKLRRDYDYDPRWWVLRRWIWRVESVEWAKPDVLLASGRAFTRRGMYKARQHAYDVELNREPQGGASR